MTRTNDAHEQPARYEVFRAATYQLVLFFILSRYALACLSRQALDFPDMRFCLARHVAFACTSICFFACSGMNELTCPVVRF